jgi:hypothetical protein
LKVCAAPVFPTNEISWLLSRLALGFLGASNFGLRRRVDDGRRERRVLPIDWLSELFGFRDAGDPPTRHHPRRQPSANACFRRISLVAACPDQGPHTEPAAATKAKDHWEVRACGR